MKPTKQQISNAVGRLGALAMFPSSGAAQSEIMRLLERMVAKQEHLDWLVETMIDRVGEWKGTKELRGVLCTRFPPADGIEAWSSIPGFTADDSEAVAMLEAVERKLIEDHEGRKQTNALVKAEKLIQ